MIFVSVKERAEHIKLLLMDCDGVLTDGRIWVLENGDDQKAFHTRDGLGLDIWHRAGLKSGIISGRHSSAVERRARALGMSFIHLGRHDKVKAFEESLLDAGVAADEAAYIGDDLNDVPLLSRSGLAVAIGDGSDDAIAQAHYVTKTRGGSGAVREVIELILKAQGRWFDLIAEYLQ
jgi:3-deoxy-D-manno-octulosonate 8-phosphate phosphatase (KDO 8-P phosphatase)